MKPQITILAGDCKYYLDYETLGGGGIDCDHVDGPGMCDTTKCPLDLSKSSVALIMHYHPRGNVEMISIGPVIGGYQTQIIMRSDRTYKITLEEVDK